MGYSRDTTRLDSDGAANWRNASPRAPTRIRRLTATLFVASSIGAVAAIGLLDSMTRDRGRGLDFSGRCLCAWIMLLDGRTYFEAGFGPPEKVPRTGVIAFSEPAAELDEFMDGTFRGPVMWEMKTARSHIAVGHCAASASSDFLGQVSGLYIFVECPSIVLMLCLSVIPFVLAFRCRWIYARDRRRTSNGRCVRCGYDLRSSGRVCSECGQIRSTSLLSKNSRPAQGE